MNPGIQIGPIRIHYYGLILTTAILVAYIFARFRAKRAKLSLALLDKIVLWAVPLALICARLYFVAFHWDHFSQDLLAIVRIWEGGIAIHGAIIGGFIGLLIAVLPKLKTISFSILAWLDVLLPSVLLGQIIGRLGNFVNQEAFGGPTDLPWGIYIAPEHRPTSLLEFSHFHPTFAYEILWNLIGLALILMLERRWSRRNIERTGATTAIYLIWYSLGRFFIEALRTDSLYIGTLKTAQIASVCAVVGGVALIWYASKTWKRKRTAKS